MALVHWAPFQEIDGLQQEMNDLLNSLLPAFNAEVGNQEAIANPQTLTPAAEIHETAEAIVLKVELPGLKAKDIDVQVMADRVAIQGDRALEQQAETKHVVRSEFRYGTFRRIIPLPARVQNDKVEAAYKDGILSLNLPKVESEKRKVVKVSLG